MTRTRRPGRLAIVLHRAFLVTRHLAGPYPGERAAAHAAALEAALEAALAGDEPEAAVRNLAPHLCRAAMLEP